MTPGAYTWTPASGRTSSTSEKCVPAATVESVANDVIVDLRRRHLRRRHVDVVAQSREHARHRVAFLVRLLEEARRDDALRVHHERPGERDAVALLVALGDGGVEDAVGA